jgi:hypothetical protein
VLGLAQSNGHYLEAGGGNFFLMLLQLSQPFTTEDSAEVA